MQLNDALYLVAAHLKLDANELIRYAEEDNIGGWDLGEGGWPCGSLWSVEGKSLYAIVKATRAQTIAEIGSFYGCSTRHLLATNAARVVAVDISHLSEAVNIDRLEQVSEDGVAWLRAQPDESLDFIFEDASHATAMVYEIAELAKSKLKPGGILMNHDAAHDFAWLGDGNKVNSTTGKDVRDGLDAAGLNYRVYRIDPSDCGFALWQKPAPEVISEPVVLSIEEAPKPRAPRKSKQSQ